MVLIKARKSRLEKAEETCEVNVLRKQSDGKNELFAIGNISWKGHVVRCSVGT